MNKIKNDYFEPLLDTIDIEDSDKGLTLLIKHDYYSSDTNHGKELLTNLLEVLSQESIKIQTVYFIDSGVKLLSEISISNLLFPILDKASSTIICADSLDEFSIELDKHSNYILYDSQMLFEQMLINRPDFIIE